MSVSSSGFWPPGPLLRKRRLPSATLRNSSAGRLEEAVSRDQRMKNQARAPIKTHLNPDEVRGLLSELCVQLGLCLPPVEVERLATSPPDDSDEFTEAVLATEGYGFLTSDPVVDQARQLVAQAFKRHRAGQFPETPSFVQNYPQTVGSEDPQAVSAMQPARIILTSATNRCIALPLPKLAYRSPSGESAALPFFGNTRSVKRGRKQKQRVP